MPLNIPCPNKIDCPGSDFPIANYSAEEPDRELWIGWNFGWDTNVPGIGTNWFTPSCLGICVSSVSQESADLCAAAANLSCHNVTDDTCLTHPENCPSPFCLDNADCDSDFCRENPQLCAHSGVFWNTAQTASAPCPGSLTTFSYTLPAHSICASSQVMADRIALSIAQTRANQLALNAYNAGACNVPTQTCLITPTTMPDAVPLSAYSQQIQVTGGTPPYTFFADPFTTPVWVSVSSTGLITGTPQASDAGLEFTFGVLVMDSLGRNCSGDITIEVEEVPQVAYQICDWPVAFNNFGGCGVDVRAAWTGLFDMEIDSGLTGFPIWFFINASLPNNTWGAADGGGIRYPAPGWQDNPAVIFTKLYWDGSNWKLRIACAAQAGPKWVWEGLGSAILDDASGCYARIAGTSNSTVPPYVRLVAVHADDLLDPTQDCPFCACGTNQNIGSLTWTSAILGITQGGAMAGGDGNMFADHIGQPGDACSIQFTSSSFCVESDSGLDITFHADVAGTNDTLTSSTLMAVRLDGLPFPGNPDFSTGDDVFNTTYDFSVNIPQGNHVLSITCAVSNDGTQFAASIHATNIRIRPLISP